MPDTLPSPSSHHRCFKTPSPVVEFSLRSQNYCNVCSVPDSKIDEDTKCGGLLDAFPVDAALAGPLRLLPRRPGDAGINRLDAPKVKLCPVAVSPDRMDWRRIARRPARPAFSVQQCLNSCRWNGLECSRGQVRPASTSSRADGRPLISPHL